MQFVLHIDCMLLAFHAADLPFGHSMASCFDFAGTVDEQLIFESIKKVNSTLLERLSDRLYFVVNKVDSIKFNTGATIQECKISVADRVTKAMNVEGFVLKPEQARHHITNEQCCHESCYAHLNLCTGSDFA